MLASGGRLEVIEDTKFFYDRDGRLTEKWDNKLVWKYEWSVEGRLLGVLKPNGERWRYEYDPLGRRIRKTGPAGTTEYLWDGATLAEEVNPQGKLTGWFYAPGSFRPIAKVENGAAYACVTDQIGTPKELVAADGTVAWSGQLTAYGETDQVGKSATDCALRFQGQYWDEETGLHYNWNRYYEPGTGQYLSADPIGLDGGTRSYGYVHSPAMWVDPWGLNPIWIDPNSLNFSQSWVSSNDYADVMQAKGWIGDPLTVIERDGQLVSFDNRRLAAAQEIGMGKVPANVVKGSDPYPPSTTGKTWDDAFNERLNRKGLGEKGTPERPAVGKEAGAERITQNRSNQVGCK